MNVPKWGDRDEFMYQLNYGDGIGRYINDLGTVGGQDAVFNPATGELKTLTAFGGYVAYQHWWSERMRSTFVAGYTDVDNLDFQLDDAYAQTKRVTANFLFSPIPRVDIGAEFLWGERTNKDGSSADAMQLQIAAKYVFYYSNGFSAADRVQSEDRAHRIGQDGALVDGQLGVYYVDLVAPGTIDEYILDTLEGKFKLANDITGGGLTKWLKSKLS